MKLLIFIAIGASSFATHSGFSQVISDTEQYFYHRHWKMYPGVEVNEQKIEADFNNDGFLDIAFTTDKLKKMTGTDDSYFWDFYIKVSDGYKRMGYRSDDNSIRMDAMTAFRKDLYCFCFIKELNSFGLLTMSEIKTKRKGSHRAQLKALLFDADGVRTVNVGSETTDIESLKRRFPKILTPPVQPVTP
jgi:hypothetical protein